MSQSRDTYDDRQPIWEKRRTERSADTIVRKKSKTKETSARGPQRWPQRAISLWDLYYYYIDELERGSSSLHHRHHFYSVLVTTCGHDHNLQPYGR
ncbi:unnamed protein product [Rotaria socialis]|uniref:Uncharacterized protein n=1 Tax=Rotaria socialis TaxID=392032 RepID=A0A818THT3_9BILA|nr:unnamed protein product [Rotaria socialis]CAF3432682.1 unnamed protein product [Rotaria socialis]CAF3551538.1 unnamed protein product [Rotaria socialis]CAF3677819.1 unnamed protein product [Rotaria socialis]CAF3693476.1 unnamed protein product [Rotaria socialis]